MEPDYLVVVDQQPAPSADFPALLKTLHHEFALDAYTCRQRLLGRAQALLCKGAGEKMQKISTCLRGYGIENYCFSPSTPKFSPFLLNQIEVKTDSLELCGKDKQFRIPRGATTLILLADISGKLVERQLSQLLSAHRFRGTTRLGDIRDNKWQNTILQGKPVLDIYLLDAQGFPTAAARALPGKFDHRGLGEKATLSSRQNLLKLAELVNSFAPASRLDMRFGLSPLPGAGLHPAAAENPEILKKNLRNLTAYAWLQADLDRVAALAQAENNNTSVDPSAVVLAALNPELVLHQQPLIKELEPHLGLAPEKPAGSEASSAGDGVDSFPVLPAPPALQHHKIWSSPRALIGLGIFVTLMLTSYLGAGNPRFSQLVGTAVESGLLSGLGAALSFWAGFKTLHLKRLVENTPTSKIRSLAMGLVEIKGTARRQFALYAPMTNIACVYYRLTRFKRNQKNQWVVSSITSSGHVPFWVEDETGRVSVDPTGAKIKAAHRQESYSDEFNTFGSLGAPGEKWCEELIYDGALVYVLGQARLKTSPVSRQQRRAEALRALKKNRTKMHEFDRDGDGKLDAQEWQAARDAVEQQLHLEDLNASSRRKRQEDQIVIGRDELRARPFVIAETATEIHLTSHYAIYAGLLLGFAILATGLTLWLAIQ